MPEAAGTIGAHEGALPRHHRQAAAAVEEEAAAAACLSQQAEESMMICKLGSTICGSPDRPEVAAGVMWTGLVASDIVGSESLSSITEGIGPSFP